MVYKCLFKVILLFCCTVLRNGFPVCFQVKMFRRSRFSVRPNVGTAARTAAASQEDPPVSQDSGDPAKDLLPSNTDTAALDKSDTPPENSTAQG